MTSLAAYTTGLCAMLLWSAYAGARVRHVRWRIWRVGGVILANWIAGMLFKAYTGNPDPWEWNLFIDSATLWAVTARPAGRWQGAIGILYGLQIATSGYYGWREFLGQPADIVFYYDQLTLLAWAQLLGVIGWGGRSLLRSLRVHSYGRRGVSNLRDSGAPG